MRILYVSQYFPPEMGAPAARVSELSREWAALGHDVTVLTGFPNHPTGVVPPAYRGQLVRREEWEGVHVVRAPIWASPNRGVVRRAASYLSFAASAALLGPLLVDRPHVVIATSPQFLVAVAGFALAGALDRPWVFEVRDLWPQSIVEVGALGQGSPVVRSLERAERFLYRKADRVVVVTDSFVDEIAAHGIPRERIAVVKNGVDLDRFRPLPRVADGRFVVTYIGTHGMAHGLGTLLDAAALLRDEPSVWFRFVGEGADKEALKARARTQGLSNVEFLDQRPRDEVARLLAQSDLCVVLLRDKPLFRSVIPSKIFEFMGAGRPIAIGVDGEARRIVEEAGAGVFVPPEDARALADVIVRLSGDAPLRAEMGRKGRAYVEANFSRRALARRYLDVLEELC